MPYKRYTTTREEDCPWGHAKTERGRTCVCVCVSAGPWPYSWYITTRRMGHAETGEDAWMCTACVGAVPLPYSWYTQNKGHVRPRQQGKVRQRYGLCDRGNTDEARARRETRRRVAPGATRRAGGPSSQRPASHCNLCFRYTWMQTASNDMLIACRIHWRDQHTS